MNEVRASDRCKGATGCTVITSARGEGLKPAKTFMGLTVEGQRDIVLMMVEEHLSRYILESIATAANFEEGMRYSRPCALVSETEVTSWAP